MDALTQKSRQQRLKRELNKSLGSVRLSNNKKLTLADKSKIKKVAVKGLQRYLTAEIKKTSTKTYDWYFFKDDGELFHIEAFRNSLNHNRYFIVDHEEIIIQSRLAHGSSYGQQRVQQFDISSKEIGDIISSSKKLFADMMKITVSEKEDAKIWRAYDNVDEKKIISVTVGLPLAIIAAAETVPLMVMASKSSAATSLVSSGKNILSITSRTIVSKGRTLFSLSKEGWRARLAYETGSEFFSNGGRVGDMNILGIGASVFSSNLGAEFVGNKYSISFNEGLESYSLEETAINIAIGRLNSGIQGNLGQLSNLLGNEGAVKAMTMSFTLAGQTGLKAINKYGKSDEKIEKSKIKK